MSTPSAELPSALREPLDRNVALLLESRIPARLAWTAPRLRPETAVASDMSGSGFMTQPAADR